MQISKIGVKVNPTIYKTYHSEALAEESHTEQTLKQVQGDRMTNLAVQHYIYPQLSMTGLFGSKKAQETENSEVIEKHDEYNDEAFNYFMEELFNLSIKKIQDGAVSYKSLMNILPQVDHNKQDDKGTTPVMMACMCNAPEILKEFLKREDQHNINAQRDFGKDTALHLAVGQTHDNLECVKQLAARDDVDVNIANSLGETPLIDAIFYENLSYVKELLKRDDVDIYKMNKSNQNALYRAKSQYNCEEIYKVLKEYEMKHPHGITDDQLRKLMMGDLSIISQVDLNAQNGDSSYTPLMHVLSKSDSYPRIIREILKQDGLDINKQAFNGKTALMQAISKKYASNDDILAILAHPDIDVNIEDCMGKTALIYAVQECNAPIVEKLLEFPNIDTEIRDTNGKDAMMYSCGQCEKLLKEYRDNKIIESLTPEENIYTQREITNMFIRFIREKDFKKAERMLEITPLIDFSQGSEETSENEVETAVFKLFKNDLKEDSAEVIRFVRKMYDYMLNKQPEMLKDYNIRREKVFEKYSGVEYNELLKLPLMTNTPEGIKYLMTRKEFDPNYNINYQTLFNVACKADSTGELAKLILSKYDNVDTEKIYAPSDKIKKLIEYYNTVGKYNIKLSSIETDLILSADTEDATNRLFEFVKTEATPDNVDSISNNALHIASTINSEKTKEIINWAIRKGFDINCKNSAGQTPLMLALKNFRRFRDSEDRRRMLGIIKFIIDKGADVNIQDIHGQTAMHYACITDSPTALKLILSAKNANIFIKDNNGKLPKVYLPNDEMRNAYRQYVETAL